MVSESGEIWLSGTNQNKTKTGDVCRLVNKIPDFKGGWDLAIRIKEDVLEEKRQLIIDTEILRVRRKV